MIPVTVQRYTMMKIAGNTHYSRIFFKDFPEFPGDDLSLSILTKLMYD
jgi:hypothetical protein